MSEHDHGQHAMSAEDLAEFFKGKDLGNRRAGLSGQTKAQLVAMYEKQLEEVATENKRLRLEVIGLQEQIQRLKDALIQGYDLELQQAAQEEVEEPTDGTGWWRRLKCRLGRHDPNPRDFQKSYPQCEHCERFYRR